MVYGSTCIDRPTDRPGDQPTDRPTDRVRPIHVILIRCMCPRCRAAMPHSCPTYELCSGNSYKSLRLRTPMMGKRKAETPAQRTARLERETSKPLHTCASLSVSPCILGFHVRQFFLLVTSHKPLFTLSYISTTRAHCILDRTLIRKCIPGYIDPTLSLSMPPTTQLRLAPSDDHHLSSSELVTILSFELHGHSCVHVHRQFGHVYYPWHLTSGKMYQDLPLSIVGRVCE